MAATPALIVDIVVAGAALLVLMKAASTTVNRLLAVAQHYDLPDVLIAMTVIAIGTSLPEIGSHVIASLGILSGTLDYRIASATVLGGNMGSSTAQQTLLVGIFLIGFGRFQLARSFVKAVYLPMLVALVLVLGLAWDGSISRVEGAVMLAGYLAYVTYSYHTRPRTARLPEVASVNVRRDVAVALLGLLAVLGSAYVILLAIQELVELLQLGGSMIGIVTLGAASALPEFSTVLESIRRRAPNVAMGTLIGSNIVNPLLAIGLGGTLSTYAVPPAIVLWDLPFKLVVGVALLAYLRFVSDRHLGRQEGLYLVLAYFAFVGGRLLLFPGQ